MIFKEFGDKNMPVIILIHGGGLSWWSWKPQIEAFKKDYRIVTPIIDGHGDAFDTTFVSIKKSAQQIIKYIKENCNGKVFAICGLSIGAQITVEILSEECDITENSVIESALVYPIKMAIALTVPLYNTCYWLIKKRWFAKLQAKSLNVPDEMFETYYEESSRMTRESLINFTISNGDYPMPLSLGNTKAKTLILVGGKEISIMKKSALLLSKTINCSILKVIEKGGHGEISLIYPDKYLNLLREFFTNNAIK
jgi:pimeloyl-ACP methyl ester carboxylesterase